ncbi:hypothetical protein [Streptomyces hygroscopicus]|nr:hypothetical protein [Streptomyces hygroscopicus]
MTRSKASRCSAARRRGGEAAAFGFPGLGQHLRAVERGNALGLFPRLA